MQPGPIATEVLRGVALDQHPDPAHQPDHEQRHGIDAQVDGEPERTDPRPVLGHDLAIEDRRGVRERPPEPGGRGDGRDQERSPTEGTPSGDERQPGGDLTLIREDVERVAIETLASLRSGLRALDAIAQIAPLLGLFGTVLGMIEAFRALQAGGSNVDPAALAGGIWVALLTTAVGLGIAMPATLAVSWFEARIDRERVAMETLLTALFTRRPTEHAANVRVLPVATGDTAGPRNAH